MIKYENSEQATKAMNSDYSSTEFSMIQITYFFSSNPEDQKEIEVVWTDGSNKIYESEEAKEKWLQVEWKWDQKWLRKEKEINLGEQIKKIIWSITISKSAEEK